MHQRTRTSLPCHKSYLFPRSILWLASHFSSSVVTTKKKLWSRTLLSTLYWDVNPGLKPRSQTLIRIWNPILNHSTDPNPDLKLEPWLQTLHPKSNHKLKPQSWLETLLKNSSLGLKPKLEFSTQFWNINLVLKPYFENLILIEYLTLKP